MSDIENAMAHWTPIAVVPSVDVHTSKLAGPHIALLGADDERYQRCVQESPDLGGFLSSFTDSHGKIVRPSLIATSTLYGGKPSPSAVASFKDIVVASVTLDERLHAILSDNVRGPFYSGSFDIYPWMISNYKDRLVARTPAISSLHRLQGFRGLASPALPIHRIEDEYVHGGLFAGLYRLWQRQYISNEDNWEPRAILRSVNMASAAMQVPITSVAETIYDWGRCISLWVSAFEILVHPGGNGQANQNKVLEMLWEIEWLYRGNRDAIYPIEFGRKRTEQRTLPEFLYNRLYRLRNDYLHGNPVEGEGFMMENGTSVLSYPAALYRMALASKVPHEDPISHEDIKSGRRSVDEYSLYYRSTLFQNDCERCLLRAVDPEAAMDDE
ncbi:hypothetical protein [Sinorhizobium meliloti]|uniref:hypothetical protein n=1 Tax=Rhizobium meliloti TaxID=382 RepID=UPI0001E4BFD6|nr:hypothetical protein [Sinorhizobium meliloti]AEG04137.1 hypothetical protein SinmeB_1212 [Sinorhizobium meliloti BL225C]MDE3828937.1 hypothetical protein [Sinorhizobium meliloti]MDE3854975.1 hypothetical protein [Sinorhizobium meliloti]MDE4545081.1 hypothetical protein [Sinorhizobium meliloti]MDE4573897.1 hypothetical protein [Sinorhizobium meliloti]